MKQALMKASGRIAATQAAVVAALLLVIVFMAVDHFPLWAVFLLAVLTLLALVALWTFRTELLSTRLAVISRDKLLRNSARQARRLHNNDVLTGLPNRTRFRDYLEQQLVTSRKKDNHLAVGILALNNLETIQDIIDDDAGDQLVSQFTDILTEEVPCYLGYVGPGIFAFLLDDISDRKTAFAMMHEIMKTVSKDLVVAELTIRIQVSGGIAICPGDADSATSLIQKAKLAMTNAKKTGAQLLLFNQSMAPDLHKLQLISDLKEALSERKLMWALQPQYDVSTKRVVGAELLIRWQHPDYGWVPPTDFIAWAEQTGLIRQITEAAIEQACLILAHMKAINRSFKLSVNLSSNDLADTDVVKRIIAQTVDYAESLTLEITETALMKDMDAVVRNVELLKTAGIKLSLDDYGTGYSSLEYLQAFCFDEIKIDRMFITDVAHVERNLKLTQASIELGHSLGAIVVAEGVEDQKSAELLIAMGCDVLQGYHIGRPVIVSDLDAYLLHSEQVRF
ncbi:MAG: bifunctional diguanylate cyclase/phosphodiesterase [Pseudohongiella sp.]|uniref:putative bifunctional diguanylate cyclase/phosphodiesterase n=1 Tax=Pseudohongiella sp. TaxID=1979412 RepID=UPI0034A0423E